MEQFLILSGLNFLTFYSYNSESFSKEYVVNLFISLSTIGLLFIVYHHLLFIHSKNQHQFVLTQRNQDLL